MEKIIGSILTGGKSSRMGGGLKGFKKFNNQSIFDRVYHRSKNQVSNLIINSNIVTDDFDKYNLPVFSDVIKGYLGPLAGIHASINWTRINYPESEWIVTFASDTPFFPKQLVKTMYAKAKKNNKKIVLARSFKRNHPIFGLWHTSLEKDLADCILKKNIRKIEEWAKDYNYKNINFENNKYDPFFNINRPDDLIKAQKIENQILDK